MPRVKIKFPDEKPLYSTCINVRIGDINYGNHLGNDSVLSIVHEARMQLLAQWGYTELKAGGNALIMGDVMISYRGEAYYGEKIKIDVYVDELNERSFDLLYHMSTLRDGVIRDIAHAKTGMVIFDYEARRVVPMNDELKNKLQGIGN